MKFNPNNPRILNKSVKKPLLLFVVVFSISYNIKAQVWDPGHRVGTLSGVYGVVYNQAPSQLVELQGAAIPNVGLQYQWYSNTTPDDASFVVISGATSSSYSPGVATQTMWYKRKSIYTANGSSIFSNTIKISVVSTNWEDINYIREHDVLVTGVTTWTAVDQLPIGQKLQTTTYLDGLGRSIQKVSRETATPSSGTLWGDMVQFSEYDQYGREVKKYLPYTTTTQSGKYKTTPLTEQASYYSNAATYNETSAFSAISFDNSPLNRVKNVKSPGTSWAGAAGNSAAYDMNGTSDNVRMFSVDYVQGDAPVYNGIYPVNTLYKITYTDENGKMVVEYINKTGQLILKKVQLDDAPSAAHSGWICTYNIYDDFGLLRFQIQPEGVKYLDNNGWSFAGANGATVLAEQIFQYNYDNKGRTIWKKAPGAQPLQMLYDVRDRVVFMQDGNQAAMTSAQWTANLYDDLDRPTITLLYNTAKTVAQLQTDINNATTTNLVTITNPNQAITDLMINNRPTVSAPIRYAAVNSIEFVSESGSDFESITGTDEFTAEIDATASTTGYTITTTTLNNPITSVDLNNAAVTAILKYQFYDNYSFSDVKSFDNNFTNTSAYSTSDPNVIPIAKSNRTISMPTGSLTRILGTNTFLGSTYYYDEKGRLIQSQEENVKSGTDITTLQYHFDGRVLSSCYSHSAPGTGYAGYITLTKNIFDKLGRVTSIQKQFGSNAFKTVSSYDYDDVGRVKTKHLDPNYNNPNSGLPDLESLNYSFNIHNQITGINKDYALKTAGNYNKWGHFFGLYLGYDNRDAVFTKINGELNGQVTGQLWNTQGDDAQRRYDYRYDNAGRLVKGDFTEKQHTGDAWDNSKMDFSVKGSSGQITYDLNGNLLTMLQRGVIPGSSSPVDIDNLQYSYTPLTNKLQSVTDQMTTTGANGRFGDFKDGTNGSNPDYVYDANGNVVIDLNKNAKDLNNVVGANGIHYNFLDKPDQIRIAGKGTINIVYSADGEKLKRTFTPEGAGTVTTTTYINQFVYQSSGQSSDALSYINFEEGRIRVMTFTSQSNGPDAISIDGNMDLPNSKRGAYDYLIMDYQQNVRMILTEETHVAANTCTMESSRAGNEDPVFGQTGAGNEVETTRYATNLTSWSGNATASVSRLGNLSGHSIGPNVLQKVMAGDNVSATVQYYYQSSTGNDNPNFVSNLLSSLVQAISGSGAASIVKDNAVGISNQLNVNPVFLSDVKPAGSGGATPKAFLTILFFDERFNFISAADGGAAQTQVASSVTSAGLTIPPLSIKAPKNGYVYVYVSNRSDQDVYFDNLNVAIAAGNIIEEDHYYAYGLKIATISSKKLGDTYEGTLDNKYQMQGSFSEMDDDIGWNDFALRNYDPQIGRWVQQDPFQQFASPYVGMGDDPANLTDPSGGDILPIHLIYAASTVAARTVGTTSTAVNTFASGLSFASIVVQVFNAATNALNTSITTTSVGNNGTGATPSQNIYIFITGNDDKFYNDVEKSNGNHIGQWYIMVVNTIMEATSSLKTYLNGTKASNIIISTHGYSGGINVDPSIDNDVLKEYDDTNCMSNEDRERWQRTVQHNFASDIKKKGIESFYEMLDQIKKGGNLVITGCRAGNGTEGKAFGSLIVNGRNLNLFLNQDPSVYSLQLTKDGMPSGYGQISYYGGHLTYPAALKFGWRKFSYNSKNGEISVSTNRFQVIVGGEQGTTPVQLESFKPKK